MKVQEAIEAIDHFKPNSYTTEDKVNWLSELDGQVFDEIISTHEGGGGTFSPYEANDLSRELLIPAPYAAEIYVNWLQSKIDRQNEEMVKFNQSATLFNTAYQNYAAYYNRRHMPISAGRFLY